MSDPRDRFLAVADQLEGWRIISVRYAEAFPGDAALALARAAAYKRAIDAIRRAAEQ